VVKEGWWFWGVLVPRNWCHPPFAALFWLEQIVPRDWCHPPFVALFWLEQIAFLRSTFYVFGATHLLAPTFWLWLVV
jgi:hypothetical protein